MEEGTATRRVERQRGAESFFSKETTRHDAAGTLITTSAHLLRNEGEQMCYEMAGLG